MNRHADLYVVVGCLVLLIAAFVVFKAIKAI